MVHLAFACVLLAIPVAFELGRTIGQRQLVRDQRALRAIVGSGRAVCRNRL